MFTVGKLLSKTRVEKGLSLRQAEQKTRIRSRYLKALEDENWSIFTSQVYIAGLIKSYAKFLAIDPEKAMAYFRRDFEKIEKTTFNKRLPRLQFLPETRVVVMGLVGIVLVFFVCYFGYQTYLFLSPPEITIVSPEKNTFRNVEHIEVTGKTQPESVVRIFGEEVYLDDRGVFSYDFPLVKGKNSLMIQVTGANGKSSEKIFSYTLE